MLPDDCITVSREINAENIVNYKSMVDQTHQGSNPAIATTQASMLQHGFVKAFPILVRESNNKTVDGATRLTAACKVVEQTGEPLTIWISYLGDEIADIVKTIANSGSRDVKAADLFDRVKLADQYGKPLCASAHAKALRDCVTAIQIKATIQDKDIPSKVEAHSAIVAHADKFIGFVHKAYVVIHNKNPIDPVIAHNIAPMIASLMVCGSIDVIPKSFLTTNKVRREKNIDQANTLIDLNQI